MKANKKKIFKLLRELIKETDSIQSPDENDSYTLGDFIEEELEPRIIEVLGKED